MTWGPEAWKRLGDAIRDDRIRQGITSREELAERVKRQGGSVTSRSIGDLERGLHRSTGKKPRTLEPTVAALGWPYGASDRILNGEEPAVVLRQEVRPEAEQASGREAVLEALPQVYAFSRQVAALGGDPDLRDQFDDLAHRLVRSIPVGGPQGRFGLAAYRPHAPGEGPADDDAERIREFFESGDPSAG
ncbi:hypothetical protein [Streptomyces boetiae]|nr:hypothetical protein [Streptomyces sp. DSM 44917]